MRFFANDGPARSHVHHESKIFWFVCLCKSKSHDDSQRRMPNRTKFFNPFSPPKCRLNSVGGSDRQTDMFERKDFGLFLPWKNLRCRGSACNASTFALTINYLIFFCFQSSPSCKMWKNALRVAHLLDVRGHRPSFSSRMNLSSTTLVKVKFTRNIALNVDLKCLRSLKPPWSSAVVFVRRNFISFLFWSRRTRAEHWTDTSSRCHAEYRKILRYFTQSFSDGFGPIPI